MSSNPVLQTFSHRTTAQGPMPAPHGLVRITDRHSFPISTIAAALVDAASGGTRERHQHPNAAEWQYCSLIAEVEDGTVRLSANSDVAVSFEEPGPKQGRFGTLVSSVACRVYERTPPKPLIGQEEGSHTAATPPAAFQIRSTTVLGHGFPRLRLHRRYDNTMAS